MPFLDIPTITPPPTTDLDDRSRSLLAEARELAALERQAMQNRVAEMNLPLARRLAHRYTGRGVGDDDLEQVASLGLLKSVRRFDPERRSFDAFAVPTVLGELRRYFRDHAWAVRPTRQVQDLQSSVATARDDLRSRLGREPSTAEIAAHVGADEADVDRAQAVRGAFSPDSLDAANPSGEGTVGDRIGVVDVDLERAERLQAVAPTVRRLSEVDRRLLSMRFVQERTQQDIGRELGISQMQVSRRLTAVIGRIQAELGLDEGARA